MPLDESRRVTDEEGGRIVDVRTPAEFREGHLENAVDIDFNAPNFR